MTTIKATVGSKQGINALKNGVQIGGTTIYTGSGTPTSTYYALRIGDLYVDYTNGAIYIATATGVSGWEQMYSTTASGAAAAVSDGGTITHGFTTAPTTVLVSGSVAGEIVTVTSIGSTTFTVAIKTNLGAAGTSQTIYWRALP